MGENICKCGNHKHKTSKTCQRCYIKTMIGDKHPHYKHGKTKNNKCINCQKHVSYYSIRCKKCEILNSKGRRKHYSREEIDRRSREMRKLRKNGVIETWNKNKFNWELCPEGVMKMKNKLKGRRLNIKGEFKKGNKAPFSGKGSRKNQISKHHVDLDRSNNHPSNILFLSNSLHNSMHRRAYDYLVELGVIERYIIWFMNKFGKQEQNNGK